MLTTDMTKTGKDARISGLIGERPDAQIAAKLRQYYDSVREQSIPDQFNDLLQKLDTAESKARETDGSKAAANRGK